MTTEGNTTGTVNCGSVAASEPLIKRYGLGTKFYPNGISVPDMVEKADGDYVRHADFELLLRHNRYLEALLAKLKSSHCESNAKAPEPVSDAAEIIDPLASESPDNGRDWASLDGAVAWHLIDRHAENWAEVGRMMDEFVAAKINAAMVRQK